MDRFKAVCEYVQDGDTFRTAGKNWIRLANVCAPELTEFGGAIAKGELERLILGKEIVYEKVGESWGRIVAEVWLDNLNINAYMRQQGYTCS